MELANGIGPAAFIRHVASLTKVSVELILLPVTLKVSSWLKKVENVDYFDKTTNFNPLKF
jgi:hypothetical protein